MSKHPQRKRKHRLSTVFMAIGEVTVAFAFLEMAVDLCINVIHHKCNGHKMGIDIPRTSFYRKLDYLRQCNDRFFAVPIMFPQLSTELIPTLENAADQRNHVIHAIALDIEKYPHTGVITLTRVKHTKKSSSTYEGKTTLKKLRAFRGDVIKLAVFVSDFHGILEDLVATHKGDEPFGKFLG